jgi:hypothetical protein
MDRLLIRGGNRLEGSVQIHGAKNAALPQIAAALLSAEPLEIGNVPDLIDVATMVGLMQEFGVMAERRPGMLLIDPHGARNAQTGYDIVRRMRASILVLGIAVVKGREVRVGGYGFPISDEGSGADLGLHAIRLTLRAGDGRALATSFTREVMIRFDNDPLEAVAWMDRATATDYATLAPLVMRHADAGDPVGRRIVREAAEQIDELVRRLIECGAPRVALIGGLASSMEPWLAPDVQRRLSPVEGDAVAGALHLARRRAVMTRVC